MNFFEVANPVADDVKVIFVSDFFVENYSGGAELTTEALVSSSPYKVHKIRSHEVTKTIVSQNKDKVWIFGNMTNLNPSVIPQIMGGCKYVVLEYDYKFCAHRCLEKHFAAEGKPCDCHARQIGEVISSFYSNASCIFWMSEKQQQIYLERFPFLEDTDQYVLSSVFNEEFFMTLKILREKFKDFQREDWLVFSSSSWIKGTDDAVEYCKNNNLKYKIVSNLSYETMLEEMSKAKGLVFLPKGGDTCPRMVIEAKLLGCDLVLNDNVQHAKEIWFDVPDLDEVEQYLYAAREIFWNYVKHEIVEIQLTLSGYTTTYNCVSQKYPFEECIKSMLGFCDEVVVVDGGSNDGTFYKLLELQSNELKSRNIEPLKGTSPDVVKQQNEISRLKIHVVERDWNSPRFALFDGMQKAEARKFCTGDFCWQQDSDEVVHENDYGKIRELINNFPRGVNLVSLPVVEYWGGKDKVRLDITPWKWRLSKNLPTITHGVPVTHRRVLEDGTMVAASGTDGCDMVHSRTGEHIPFIGFYTNEAHEARTKALSGDKQALDAYEKWFQTVVEKIPSVYHFSWFDIERKIKTYKNYWTKHWESLTGKTYVDTPETNMFFDLPWSEVTDDMIREKAKELSSIGGWIWHTKWKGQNTPWLTLSSAFPSIMENWTKKENGR